MLGLAHGDNSVLCRVDDELEWIAHGALEAYCTAGHGEVGLGIEPGDVQAVICLNRAIRWLPDGIAAEADPRPA